MEVPQLKKTFSLSSILSNLVRSTPSAKSRRSFPLAPPNLEDKYHEPVKSLIHVCNSALNGQHKITYEQRFENDDYASGALSLIVLKIHPTEIATDPIRLEMALIERLKDLLGADEFDSLNIEFKKTEDGSYGCNLSPAGLLKITLNNLKQIDQYTEPLNTLTNVCNGLLCGQQFVTYERRYQYYEACNSETAIPSGPLKSIMLKVLPCETGLPQNTVEIGDALVEKLKELLGVDRYGDLFTHSRYKIAKDTSYFLNLNPEELLKIDLSQPMAGETHEAFSLRNAWTEMYGLGSDEKTASLKKDFVAMQNMYNSFIKVVAFDSEFNDELIQQNLVYPQNQSLCFIEYIKKNPQYHPILRQVFNNTDPEVNKAKLNAYVRYCQSKLHEFESGTLMSEWYSNLENVVTCCHAWIAAEEEKYVPSVNCVIDSSKCILGQAYLVTYDQNQHGSAPPNSITLKVMPSKKGSEMSDVNFRLIEELKNQLGEKNFNRLVIKHGKTSDGTYLISLSIAALQVLKPELQQLQQALESATEGELAARRARLVDKKVELFSSSKELNEVLDAMKEDYETLPKQDILSYSKNDLRAIFTIYTAFKEAVISDHQFQAILIASNINPSDVLSEMVQRYDCFTIYIEHHPRYKEILNQIFNCADPLASDAKFQKTTDYLYEQVSKLGLSGNAVKSDCCSILQEILGCSYHCIHSEQRIYAAAANGLIKACNLGLSYPCSITYEQRFSGYASNTVSGHLEHIMLRIVPHETNIVRGGIAEVINSLISFLGIEICSRLIRAYKMEDGTTHITLKEDAYCLFLDPAHLLTINSTALITLSPADLKMYDAMTEAKKIACGKVVNLNKAIEVLKREIEEATTSSPKKQSRLKALEISLVKQEELVSMYSDLLHVYEIYVRFNSRFNTDSRFKSSLITTARQSLSGVNQLHACFVQYIRTTPYYQNMMKEISARPVLNEGENKWASYLQFCSEEAAKHDLESDEFRWFHTLHAIVMNCYVSVSASETTTQ